MSFFRLLGATIFVAFILCTATLDATTVSRTAASTVASISTVSIAAHEEAVLHVFTGADGAFPSGDLIADRAGNLYGATAQGGAGICPFYGCGAVYKLSPPSPGHTAWTETVLYAFDAFPGSPIAGVNPIGRLVMDSSGALYGLTFNGGGSKNPRCYSGCGTAFKLTPPGRNKAAWTQSVLYTFTGGADGAQPRAGLITDASGALYGITESGGYARCFCGVVFKLAPPTRGRTAWTETVLHAFTGPDGKNPGAGLIMDAGGALYGTTETGGSVLSHCSRSDPSIGSGTVFQLTPPAPGKSSWTERVLFSFSGGVDGKYPEAELLGDAHGALYGTTYNGGITTRACYDGCGTAFKLSPPVAPKTTWTKSLLHSFNGADGAFPTSKLIADARGDLYGTASSGGGGSTACIPYGGCGTTFKLAPPRSAATAWTETVLHFFTGTASDGDQPSWSLLNVNGSLYGTTSGLNTCAPGGGGCGTVFKI